MIKKNNHIAVLLSGTNKGILKANLLFALEKIEASNNQIIKKSNLFYSEAWGFESDDFLNQAILIETTQTAIELLDTLQSIEKAAGRKSKTITANYEARVLDIDIIFYDNEIIHHQNLMIPHPRMQNRRFVLEPLAEIIPEYRHPKLNKTVRELIKICPDEGKVWK